MSPATLSVVIPTFNRASNLRSTLLALAAQDYPRDRFEVVVAVDGSTDDTMAMLSSIDTPYRLVSSWAKRAGTAAARNRALAVATGDVVVSLDDDIIAAPHLLSAHADLQDADERVVGLGRLELPGGTHLDSFSCYWHARFDEITGKSPGPLRPEFVDCLTGNLSVRRRDVVAVGGFDPAFRHFNHEDIELDIGCAYRALPSCICRRRLGSTISARVSRKAAGMPTATGDRASSSPENIRPSPRGCASPNAGTCRSPPTWHGRRCCVNLRPLD